MNNIHNGNLPHPERPERRPKRSRGGQPGNQNARKRGILNRPLTPQQRNTLRAVRRAGLLSPSLNMMRIRFAALLSEPSAGPEVLLRATRVFVRWLRVEAKARYARETRGRFPQ